MSNLLPRSIAELTENKIGKLDSIGMSDSEIIIYDDCVLKIMPHRAVVDKSVEMMK